MFLEIEGSVVFLGEIFFCNEAGDHDPMIRGHPLHASSTGHKMFGPLMVGGPHGLVEISHTSYNIKFLNVSKLIIGLICGTNYSMFSMLLRSPSKRN